MQNEPQHKRHIANSEKYHIREVPLYTVWSQQTNLVHVAVTANQREQRGRSSSDWNDARISLEGDGSRIVHGTKDDTSSICREDGHHVEIQWEPNEFKGHRSNARFERRMRAWLRSKRKEASIVESSKHSVQFNHWKRHQSGYKQKLGGWYGRWYQRATQMSYSWTSRRDARQSDSAEDDK